MNYRFYLTTLSVIILHQGIWGQQFSERRTFARTVAVNRDMTLEISNKYGTIHITSWNVDSVSVRAEIEASASNQSRIGKMIDGISINISETDYLIRAQTSFSQSLNMIFESFKGMTNKLIPYDSRVQINYYVSMPEYLNLKIENRYGDLYMESNSSVFSANLSNGSFRATSLKKISGLSLTFCDATVKSIEEGIIDISFSDIFAGDLGSVRINSISSRLDIKKCSRLDVDSKRDKFFLGSVGSLRGTAYFTDFRIEKLLTDTDLSLKYGSLTTDMVNTSVNSIALVSGYSDISITFDPSLTYSLDIRHISAYLSLPDKNSQLEKKIISDEKKEYITFGTVGRGSPKLKAKIDATRGNIFIK